MQPDEFLRAGSRLREAGNGQSGSIRRDDRRRANHGRGRPSDLGFDRDVLEHSLDDQITAGEGSEIPGRLDPAENEVRLLPSAPASLDFLVHDGRIACLATSGKLARSVQQDDVNPGACGDIGDPGSHHPGTQHTETPNLALRNSPRAPGNLPASPLFTNMVRMMLRSPDERAAGRSTWTRAARPGRKATSFLRTRTARW